jgi:hypothetical protein
MDAQRQQVTDGNNKSKTKPQSSLMRDLSPEEISELKKEIGRSETVIQNYLQSQDWDSSK